MMISKLFLYYLFLNFDYFLLFTKKGHPEDLVVGTLEIREGSRSRTFAEKTLGCESVSSEPFVLPSIYNHFVAVANETNTFACRRDMSLRTPADFIHSNLGALVPNVRSIVDFESSQLITQIPHKFKPKRLDSNHAPSPSLDGLLGYLELVDLSHKEVKYLPVVSPSQDKNRNEPWRSYMSFSDTNEAEFLFDLSPTKPGCVYTLDFNGTLSAWETSRNDLEKSLDEWQKLVAHREQDGLKIEVFKDSPNKELKDFNGPKHGKVDPENMPHFGGNTWAGNNLKKEIFVFFVKFSKIFKNFQ